MLERNNNNINSSSSDPTTSGLHIRLVHQILIQLDGLEIVEYDSINSRSHIVVYENDDDNNEQNHQELF